MTEVRICKVKTNKNLTEESRFTVAEERKDFGMEKRKKERESERDEE